MMNPLSKCDFAIVGNCQLLVCRIGSSIAIFEGIVRLSFEGTCGISSNVFTISIGTLS